MNAMLGMLQELMKLNNAQLVDLIEDFTSKLPNYLENALKKQITVV